MQSLLLTIFMVNLVIINTPFIPQICIPFNIIQDTYYINWDTYLKGGWSIKYKSKMTRIQLFYFEILRYDTYIIK